ncbi:hypothetical protein BVC80_9043g5 [Macleaya cordata]|uniref:F-box domain-containing protein n=1 Tax=Macleaya cordata TaxID=56857 RepID=A0A200R2L9_MACCD|nr:hypothetical protein BVC80_9043g5 [Macleaya cordata]
MIFCEDDLQEEQEAHPLHGDLLDAVISHVPLIHLVPASYVSKTWRCAVSSCIHNPSRTKPWLIIHAQSPWNPSTILTRAYDPSSHVWIEITGPTTTTYSSPLRSSHSNALYLLTPSKFSFSSDPLHDTWQNVVGPHVWRTDPIVAVVGSYVVVAGGTYEFEDDPLAVEIYDMASPGWSTCQPMPIILKNSAATTWLSVAVSDQKMYLLDKNSGIFCSFDPNTKIWSGIGGTFDLRPNPSIYFSVIGFSGHRLILVGLMGDAENAESLRLWEVNCDNFECEEIGKMPWGMFQRLKNENSMLLSIDISAAENFVYMYNSSEPKEIFFCEFNGGNCEWGSVRNSFLTDQDRMDRFIFTCSKVGLDDLRKAFWLGNRKFKVEFAEK